MDQDEPAQDELGSGRRCGATGPNTKPKPKPEPKPNLTLIRTLTLALTVTLTRRGATGAVVDQDEPAAQDELGAGRV